MDVEEYNSMGRDRVSSYSILDPALPPHVDETKLLRKIDVRVLPILFAVYIVAFLDRQALPLLMQYPQSNYCLSSASTSPMHSR